MVRGKQGHCEQGEPQKDYRLSHCKVTQLQQKSKKISLDDTFTCFWGHKVSEAGCNV